MNRLGRDFYIRDVLEVAPGLLGKKLVRVMDNGKIIEVVISEVEAYRGEEDEACHARKGRTERNSIMYDEGGRLYLYLIYGMYWMLNVVTGKRNDPQAVLIRGLLEVDGPGRLTRYLGLDKSFYGIHLADSGLIWIEEGVPGPEYETTPRIGIEYAGEYWKSRPWRYVMKI